MRYSIYLIGLLLVFLVFTATGGLYINLSQKDKYNVTLSPTFQTAYTNTTELADFIEDTTDIGLDMTNKSTTAKQLETEYDDPTKSQLRALKLAWNSFGIVKNLIYNVANLLKIPPYIVAVGIGVIIFLLLFAFITLILRFKS